VTGLAFDVNALNVGNSTLTVNVSETYGVETAQTSDNDVVIVSKLNGPFSVLPSGGIISTLLFNSTWTAANGGVGTVKYDVILGVDAVNYSIITNTTNVYAQVNNTDEGVGRMYVRAKDQYFTDAYVASAATFQIALNPTISADVCAALTYPNEDDAPSTVKIPVNFSVSYPLGFVSPVVNVSVKKGGQTYYHDACSVVINSPTQRSYNCTVPMRYFYSPGNYDLNVTVYDDGKMASSVTSGVCTYGQLVASKRTTLAVGFPTAGPGVNNAPGDTPVNVRNTGNVDLDIFMTGTDLDGRSSPGNKLAASTFKVGESLGTAVSMQNGVQKNLSMSIPAGEAAQENILMWLSMPQEQLLQDYYASTPWTVVTTG